MLKVGNIEKISLVKIVKRISRKRGIQEEELGSVLQAMGQETNQ